MKTEIKSANGKDFLIIELPLEADPGLSGSGKSRVVASTRGNVKTTTKHPKLGEEITIGVNAYIPVG